MRALVSVVWLAFFAFGLVVLGGCASAPPPSPPPPPPPPPVEPPAPIAKSDAAADRAVPRVIRRIVAEEKELLARSRELAAELRDPAGRKRALAEVDDLAAELARVEAPLATSATTGANGTEGPDSEQLDTAVRELVRLDSRLTILHEALRTATQRTTAMAVD